MIDRENVIKALKCRAINMHKKDCETCAYRCDIGRRIGCDFMSICREALGLLEEDNTVEHAVKVLDANGWKRDDGEWVNELIQGTKVEQTADKIVCTVIGRQEARLLTLEEVRKLPSETLLWQEYKNRPYVIPVCLIAVRKQPEELVGEPPEEVIDFGDGYDSTEDYGAYYRLWTAKPTEEQRREAKWE